MNNKILRISEILIQTQGLDIQIYDDSFVAKSLEKRLKETDIQTFSGYCDFLRESKTEALSFFSSLNISYSEFFRNPLTFGVLGQIVLPAMIKKKKEIRIWSAACAAGQEAYSLAILCDETMQTFNNSGRFRIFATDINVTELQKAKNGVYTEASLANVSLKRLQKYFVKQNANYTVVPGLKTYIDYSVFDLFNAENSAPPASIFGNFDLVFCSNLLFYYKPEYRRQIIKKITHSLAPDGFLVTGETEREMIDEKDYREVFKPAAVFQKRYEG